MKNFAILSLFLGLVVAEPILLPHPNPYPVRSNGHSRIGALRPRKPIERFNLALNSTNRIVGGELAVEGDAPHQVSLQTGSHRCGASIISSTWMVTAAHCTDGYQNSPGSLYVRYGSLKHASGGTRVQLSRVVQHPNYDSWTIDNDISLLQVGSPISLGSALINSIGLPDQEPADGVNVVVTGWGTTAESGSIPADLRKVTVPIVSRARCNTAYGSSGYTISNAMICAAADGGGKDACQGDSGGPLVDADGKLAGAVSWGIGCARPAYPGVYANVAYFRDWIRTNSGV